MAFYPIFVQLHKELMIKRFTIFSALILLTHFVQAQVIITKTGRIATHLQQDENIASSDVASLRIMDDYYDKENNLNYVYVQQMYKGLPIFNGLAMAAFRDDKIVHSTNSLVSKLEKRSLTDNEFINANQAFDLVYARVSDDFASVPHKASQQDKSKWVINDTELSDYPINIELGYLFQNNTLHKSWFVQYVTKDLQHTWYVHVSASTGEILLKDDLVVSCSFGHNANSCDHPVALPETQRVQRTHKTQADASYEVFNYPIESPNHGNRTIVEDPADSTASPFGWHDIDGQEGADYTTTQGNNVRARDDRDRNNTGGLLVSGGASLEFTAPFDKNQSADNFLDAAIINLFYWNNLMHDVWYHYGFDEASGNFQENNYGKGGVGSDFVNADAQDGSGTNNANFNPLPEGQNPRMQMFLWVRASNGAGYFQVNSPEKITGKYTALPSAFGPRLTTTPITGKLVMVDDGSANGSSGCNTLTNAAEINGNIALIDRGGCTFVQKVTNAQAAGAKAVVVVNNVGGNPINMGGTGGSISIPQLMIRLDNGTTIKDEMANGDVTVSLYDSNSNGGTFYFDSDFDNGIIAHEYTHGFSTRLTGGPANSACLRNVEQMGEGWSDFLSLVMTHEPGDQGSDKRGIGTYVRNQPTDGGGIRPYPYSTSMAITPVTYNYIKQNAFTVPHGVGSVWCTMLWDLYWAFIDEYGYDDDIYRGTGGNNMVMHLVMDGLKLQPCGPGFVDGRDAILKADELRYGKKNEALIWKVFARRGLGYSADQGSANSKSDGTQAFDLPPWLGKIVIDKTVQDVVQSGDTITYSIKVKNTGTVDLENVTVQDSLGKSGKYLDLNNPCGIVFDQASNKFSHVIPTMKPGDSIECQYMVVIDTGAGGVQKWFDDVETDTLGWTGISDVGASAWRRSTTTANSGSYSWFIHNSSAQSDYRLENSFDLTSIENPVFSFVHLYNTEADWDGAVLEINDGDGWEDLEAQFIQGGYNATIENNPASRIRNQRAFSGNSREFVHSVIDLSPYKGKEVQIRFRFVSDAAAGGVGWYIDDITLWDNFGVIENRLSASSKDFTPLPVSVVRVINKIEQIIVPVDTTDPVDTIPLPVYEPGLFIFPNPTNDQVHIDFRSDVKRCLDLGLFDTKGKDIWFGEVKTDVRTSIDVSHLASGIYLLRIEDGEKVEVVKIMKY
jgi:uncharacterized repeat protein (TIGR01451 family)